MAVGRQNADVAVRDFIPDCCVELHNYEHNMFIIKCLLMLVS